MNRVCSRYIGRLGNNMFQLAAAIGYAKRFGMEWHSERENKEVPKWFEFFPNLKLGATLGNAYQCHDPSTFNFKPIPNIGSCRLMGFFQSEKYFEHCADEVKEVFKLPIVEGYLHTCSIHVRRGDYVKYSSSFPPISIEWVNKAIDEMKKRGVTKFLIFSDDIQWCKMNLPGHSYSEGLNEFEDMALMASCGDHIICNSSFSWWAAWLGINPDRHVIAPLHKNWFGKKNGVVMAIGEPKDIIPERWQQI